MIAFDDIRRKLTQEWHNGSTQAELAKKYGINQPNIGKILAGQTEGKKISLDFLNRLFPHCSLNGEISIGDNSNAQIDSPRAEMSIEGGKIQKIITRIIKSDIPPEVKDKVLNIILDE